MYTPFPVHEIEGSAHDCGEAHGRLAAERVQQTLDIYLPSFERQAGLSLADTRARARTFAQSIREIDLDILHELEGIAAGSKQAFEDIVAVNCRTELLYGSAMGLKPATECTTIAVLPEAARDGGVIVGKNWDWRNGCVDSIVVLKIRQQRKPALTLIVEAGMVGRDGFNEEGIAICGNLLVSNEDRGHVGVPIPILRRQVLNAHHYYEAIDRLVRAPRGASGNYLIAHRGGVAIDFELSPKQAFQVYPERGLLTHSNHFQSVVAQSTGVAKFYTGDSLYRDFRARQLLEPKIGSITVDDVKDTLRDHFGHPRSICRHPHDYPGSEPTMTVSSQVFDLKNNRVHIAAGQPCQSEYHSVGLPGSD